MAYYVVAVEGVVFRGGGVVYVRATYEATGHGVGIISVVYDYAGQFTLLCVYYIKEYGDSGWLMTYIYVVGSI